MGTYRSNQGGIELVVANGVIGMNAVGVDIAAPWPDDLTPALALDVLELHGAPERTHYFSTPDQYAATAYTDADLIYLAYSALSGLKLRQEQRQEQRTKDAEAKALRAAYNDKTRSELIDLLVERDAK